MTMDIKRIIYTAIAGVVVWLVTTFILYWLPGRYFFSFLIALLGVVVAIGIQSLLIKRGLASTSIFAFISGGIVSVVFLAVAASQCAEWESVTIDCYSSNTTDPTLPNYAVDPYTAVIKLNGHLFWKEKKGKEFTILNIRDKATNKESTPFREPTSLPKKVIKGLNGRTTGDRAKQSGEFKYDIDCKENGVTIRTIDPMIKVP